MALSTRTQRFLRQYGSPEAKRLVDTEAKLTRPATSTTERLAKQPEVIAKLMALPVTLRVRPLVRVGDEGWAAEPTATIVRKGIRKGKRGGVYQMYHVRGQSGRMDFEMSSGETLKLHAGHEAIVTHNFHLISAATYIAQED